MGTLTPAGIRAMLSSVRLWDTDAPRRAELAKQLEDIFDQVWACERWWSVERRIDAAVARQR